MPGTGISAGSSRPRSSSPQRCRFHRRTAAGLSRSSSAAGLAIHDSSRSTLTDARSPMDVAGGEPGSYAMCPGRKHLVELAYIGSGSTLVARKTRTLRVQRRQLVNLPGGRYAQRLRCEDGSGTSAVIFSRGPVGDSPAGSALYRMRAGRVSTLWSGAAFDAEITSSAAYLSAGNSGKTLIRVDLSTGRTKRLATLPASTTSLKLNRAETLLAGIAASTGRPSQLVRVDLTRKPATVVVKPLSRGEVYGQVFWLPTGRLLFVPAYGGTEARILDDVAAHAVTVQVDRRHGGCSSARRCSAPTRPCRSSGRSFHPARSASSGSSLDGRACLLPPRSDQRWPKECGRGSDSHTVSSAATRRASGPSDSSDETRTFRFSPTRS